MTPASRKLWTVSIVLAAITFAVFLPAREFDFVNYDDPKYLVENPKVRAGLTVDGFKWAFTSVHASNWHPLTWISLMLDAELSGPGPRGPHVTNVVLHVINSVLVLIALWTLTGALWRSAFVGALFALHPLHVESVAWIAERKDVLSAFFGLLAIICYARYALVRSKSAYVLALFCLILGLLSKAMLVTLPFVFLLLDFWPLKRIQWIAQNSANANASVARRQLDWKQAFAVAREKWPFFAVAIASSIVTFAAQKSGGSIHTLSSLTFAERFANAIVAYSRYLGKTFWPVDLAVFYPRPDQVPLVVVAFASLVLIVCCAFALWTSRRAPFVATGWFLFMGMLVPVIGLVQVGDQAMADRYTYLPLIGIFVVIAWGAGEITRSRVAPGVLAGFGVVVIAACAVKTRTQLAYWRNTETLFTHAINVTQGNYLAHYNLGNFLLEQGRVDEALHHFEQTIVWRPAFAEAHNNLALMLRRKGRIAEAIHHFERAIELEPELAIAHNGLGNLLLHEGRTADAIAHYEKALKLDPNLAEAHFNLGFALAGQGNVQQAEFHYRRAAELRPDLAETVRQRLEQLTTRAPGPTGGQ